LVGQRLDQLRQLFVDLDLIGQRYLNVVLFWQCVDQHLELDDLDRGRLDLDRGCLDQHWRCFDLDRRGHFVVVDFNLVGQRLDQLRQLFVDLDLIGQRYLNVVLFWQCVDQHLELRERFDFDQFIDLKLHVELDLEFDIDVDQQFNLNRWFDHDQHDLGRP
ncbi:MAG: hypothetical protein ACK442_08355, partial [Novosphingobium sp.]